MICLLPKRVPFPRQKHILQVLVSTKPGDIRIRTMHTHDTRDERSNDRKYAKYFRVLEIQEGKLTREILRRQYIAMVKKYHPDTATNSENASMEKFLEIDEVRAVI